MKIQSRSPVSPPLSSPPSGEKALRAALAQPAKLNELFKAADTLLSRTEGRTRVTYTPKVGEVRPLGDGKNFLVALETHSTFGLEQRKRVPVSPQGEYLGGVFAAKIKTLVDQRGPEGLGPEVAEPARAAELTPLVISDSRSRDGGLLEAQVDFASGKFYLKSTPSGFVPDPSLLKPSWFGPLALNQAAA